MELEAIQELEAMQRAESSLFGPSPVLAHVRDQGHYHYFWRCSWVYNHPNSYAITVHLCSTDYSYVQSVGSAVASILVVPITRNPFLVGMTGVVVYSGFELCKDANGNCRFYLSDYRATFGWMKYGTPLAPWFWFFPEGDPSFGYARRENGQYYWVKFW